MKDNLLLQTDVYKFGHKDQYPPGTKKVYSYLESRGSREEGIDYTVFFGLQYYLLRYLSGCVTGDDVEEYVEVASSIIGRGNVNAEQFWDLAGLGYIPLEIKAVDEGAVVPLRNAIMTITNTHPDFAWLVNYVETLLMKVWLPITVASNSLRLKRMFNHFADQTVGNRDHVPFQMHDFGYRGCGSEESAAIAGAAHLTSFLGTDTTAGVVFLRDYYSGKHNQPLGLSVPASEHSVMCAWDNGDGDDLAAIRNMLDTYPSGIVSIVSDTYNLWRAIEHFGTTLKNEVMSRDGKVVIRPDSGDPESIVCGRIAMVGAKLESPEHMGVVQLLDRYFGGQENSVGYRQLDEHVGVIYGDGIFYNRAKAILSHLAGMGYSSSNIVFGSGGLLLNQWSRDTLKMAIKATYCEVNGQPRNLQKTPVTDNGKRSKKGLLRLVRKDDGSYETLEECTPDQEAGGELKTVYKNGSVMNRKTIKQIRDRIESHELETVLT